MVQMLRFTGGEVDKNRVALGPNVACADIRGL